MEPLPAVPVVKRSFLAKLRRPRVAIPLGILFLLLLAPFAIRGYLLSQIPDVGEPFDVVEFADYTVPDEENAYTHYRRAAEMMTVPSPAVEEARDNVNEYGWSWATPELEAYLEENAEAFAEWRAGAQKERALYYPADEYTLGTLLPIPQASRSYAQSILAITHRLEAEGKSREAWEPMRDLLRTSRHIGTRGTMIERLVGNALFDVLTKRIETWSSDPTLTADDLRVAMNDLESAWSMTSKTSDALKIEYISLNNLYDAIADGDSGASDGLIRYGAIRFIIAEPERARRVVKFFFRNQLKYCEVPRWERPHWSGDLRLYDDPSVLESSGRIWTIDEFEMVAGRSSFGFMLLPAVSQFLVSIDLQNASKRCVLCLLAAQAYHRDFGRFPESLEELTPDYLTEHPIDPFDGQPLRFRFNNEAPSVYSVSFDLEDDGGSIVSGQSITWGSNPLDFGYRLIPPGSRPLVAPKPPVVEDEPGLWDVP